MYIERIQVEEGFLDGLDIQLVAGLNVIIGARGTGKTSLIELVRFCLGVEGFTAETSKRSREHALSVLGSGQITVSISTAAGKVTVSRTAADLSPRSSGPFVPPIVFSQTEIESIGLHAAGRLQLIDEFIDDRRRHDVAEAEAISLVRLRTTEAESIRRELDEMSRQVAAINDVNQQLIDLAPQEQELSGLSTETAQRKQQLDTLSEQIASLSVLEAASSRFIQSTSRWLDAALVARNAIPNLEESQTRDVADPLATAKNLIDKAKRHSEQILIELRNAIAEAARVKDALALQLVPLQEQSRNIRKELDASLAGAGAIARQGQLLREKKAQLESLAAIAVQRAHELNRVLEARSEALDQLEAVREQRFHARNIVAGNLNAELGPRLKIDITRAGQFEAYATAIADTLRGSGIRYGNLSSTLAASISPRELLDAADANDFEMIADSTGISKDRAARMLAQLREVDLGPLATVPVEDQVEFHLLDGASYKPIAALSTGQRCTVILPLVLRHTNRLLIVDQPEDHIDNAFIADTLIKSLLLRNPEGQVLFSTHNANIPVLGNADRVVHLGSDGYHGFALACESLTEPAVVNAITTIMEGGAQAFETRATFYSRHFQQ